MCPKVNRLMEILSYETFAANRKEKDSLFVHKNQWHIVAPLKILRPSIMLLMRGYICSDLKNWNKKSQTLQTKQKNETNSSMLSKACIETKSFNEIELFMMQIHRIYYGRQEQIK